MYGGRSKLITGLLLVVACFSEEGFIWVAHFLEASDSSDYTVVAVRLLKALMSETRGPEVVQRLSRVLYLSGLSLDGREPA